MAVLSIFFLTGCNNLEEKNNNDYQQKEEKGEVDKSDDNYQDNNDNEKTDDIGWTEEDWERYWETIRNSDN